MAVTWGKWLVNVIWNSPHFLLTRQHDLLDEDLTEVFRKQVRGGKGCLFFTYHLCSSFIPYYFLGSVQRATQF